MQALEKVTVDWRALVGWNALRGPVREQILASLLRLASQPRGHLPNGEVVPLATPGENLYTLRAPDGLLVTFRWEEGGRITVLDLVLKETIERYFARKS
jgi:hypothetical protein